MAEPLGLFRSSPRLQDLLTGGYAILGRNSDDVGSYKELVVLRYLLGDPDKGGEHDLVITFSQLEPPYSSVLQDHALKGIDELLSVSAARFLIRLSDKLSGHVAVE